MAVQVDGYCELCKVKSSPMFRQGPNGPRTLCNACGVKVHRDKHNSSARHPSTPAPPNSAPKPAKRNRRKSPAALSGSKATRKRAAIAKTALRAEPPVLDEEAIESDSEVFVCADKSIETNDHYYHFGDMLDCDMEMNWDTCIRKAADDGGTVCGEDLFLQDAIYSAWRCKRQVTCYALINNRHC
jgi:hypothetical protein